MGKLSVSVEGMAAVEAERAKKKQALDRLTSTPFDIHDIEQLKTIKKYTKAFELSVNKMYLYHGMSEGASIGGGGWILGLMLPIPDFIKYIFSTFLYVGVVGFMLERFSMTDFYEQLDEMKVIYNWALKGGQEEYSAEIDNTEKLANPVIQDLLKTIAPTCSVDFLLAWPRVTALHKEQNSGWLGAISRTFFNPKSTPDLKEIEALKRATETRAFDIGFVNGFKQAVSYFASTTDYGDLMKSGVGVVQEMLPTVMSYAPK